MLFSIFKDHPHVIVTKLSPQEMQSHLTLHAPSRTIAEKPTVTPAFEDLKFIGIIGSDTANKLAIPHDDPKKEEERKKQIAKNHVRACNTSEVKALKFFSVKHGIDEIREETDGHQASYNEV